MISRLSALVLAVALVLSVTGRATRAQSQSADGQKTATAKSGIDLPRATRNMESNEKLKTDVRNLVADTKAGKVTLPRASQFSSPTSHNLSKTAKIAIVAGVVLVIVALIIVHGVKNAHCETRCVL